MKNATLEPDFLANFSAEWIEAWNSRDLERVLSHYATEIELTSMFVPRILGVGGCTVRGIGMLRLYFSEALARFPDLKFLAREVYTGPSSVIIHYQSVGGRLAAEMMSLDKQGLIRRVYAHYLEIGTDVPSRRSSQTVLV